MTATATIPPEWHAALEAAPTCLVLRRALADWFDEQGDAVAAEALRWSVSKSRSPTRPFGEWGWSGSGGMAYESDLPDALYDKPPTYLGIADNSVVRSMERLIGRWRNSTPEEREGYWRWTP